jgi:hypothetical protein
MCSYRHCTTRDPLRNLKRRCVIRDDHTSLPTESFSLPLVKQLQIPAELTLRFEALRERRKRCVTIHIVIEPAKAAEQN